jgi:TRAP-type transport system periplasmic protein
LEAKFYEAAPNFSVTNHIFEPSFLIISQSFWEGLTPEQQNAFTQVGQDMVAWAFDSAEQNDRKYFVELAKVSTMNEVKDFKPFQALVEPVYKSYAAKYGNDWLELINQARN